MHNIYIMPRYTSYYPQILPDPDTQVTLDKTESHHLISVLRARPGSSVTLFNPHNQAALCQLSQSSPSGATLTIKEHLIINPPSPIILAQAIPKAKGMDSIIRKSVEIGVSTIIPMLTENTEVRLDEKKAESKVDKWETTAIEACKQSSNYNTPQLSPVQKLTKTLEHYNSFQGMKFIASLQPQAQPLHHYLKEKPEQVIFMVGPEGDFSEKEYTQAENAGFLPVSLGKNVLRVETATTYFLSILDYELKRLSS